MWIITVLNVKYLSNVSPLRWDLIQHSLIQPTVASFWQQSVFRSIDFEVCRAAEVYLPKLKYVNNTIPLNNWL